MRIASNVPEGHMIQRMPYPVMIKKYPCKYFIKLNTGKTIYFTGVRSTDDIRLKQFSCVVKDRSEDAYVLAPTLTDTDRETTLILIQLEKNQEVLSLQQSCLFDFFHWNDTNDGTFIAGLAYNFPEIYTYEAGILRLYVSTEKEGCVLLDTGYYQVKWSTVEYHSLPAYAEYSPCALKKYGTFVLHAATKTWANDSAQSYIHPATRFVIDSRNVIFINNLMDLSEITEFLKNGNIPSDVVIIWASEDPEDVDFVEDMVKGYVLATTQFHHYIFIGFTYLRTVKMRTFVTAENLKKITAQQQ